MREDSVKPRLKRSIGLAGMVFYGVGTMIGGGFYALLGKIIGEAGIFTPLSLLLACGLALVSALSFAELARRYPVSAGEVQYVQSAFGWSRLSQLVGVLVIMTGLVSSATLCAATGGFLLDLTSAPIPLLIAVTTVVLTAIAAWGVNQSVIVVAIITLIEAGTLLLIIILSPDKALELPTLIIDMVNGWDQIEGAVILTTAFLAFYAFVGFEDMVNMSEETRDAEHTMPRAIAIAVIITVVLYAGVTLVALGFEDRQALATAHTPLALLLPETRFSGLTIGLISILAGLNGALVQLVMAARVMYGMADRGMAPRPLARVHPVTRTPLLATVVAGVIVLVLATSFPLKGLAEATSFIILTVFLLVNLSLAVIRCRETPHIRLTTLAWMPIIAALSCLAMLVLRSVTALA